MRRLRVIPVLLIQDGGLVKSIKFKKHKYVGDPINAVRIFNDKEVDELIVLDISKKRYKHGPDINQVMEIGGEAFMPLAYGGGINYLQQIEKILYNGAEKVVLNTAIFENPELISEAAKRFGSQAIVASIDIGKNWLGKLYVYSHNAQKKTTHTAIEIASKAVDLGAGEVLLNSVDNDGTFNGYDLKLIEKVAKDVAVPLIACGGAATINDFRLAIEHGASAVAAGSMFVFQPPHRAVLISYPTQAELKEKLFTKI